MPMNNDAAAGQRAPAAAPAALAVATTLAAAAMRLGAADAWKQCASAAPHRGTVHL